MRGIACMCMSIHRLLYGILSAVVSMVRLLLTARPAAAYQVLLPAVNNMTSLLVRVSVACSLSAVTVWLPLFFLMTPLCQAIQRSRATQSSGRRPTVVMSHTHSEWNRKSWRHSCVQLDSSACLLFAASSARCFDRSRWLAAVQKNMNVMEYYVIEAFRIVNTIYPFYGLEFWDHNW